MYVARDFDQKGASHVVFLEVPEWDEAKNRWTCSAPNQLLAALSDRFAEQLFGRLLKRGREIVRLTGHIERLPDEC